MILFQTPPWKVKMLSETIIKRYLLFAGYSYYPAGGWNDFVDSYDTREEAEQSAKNICLLEEYTIPTGKYDWCHVIDSQDGEKGTYVE